MKLKIQFVHKDSLKKIIILASIYFLVGILVVSLWEYFGQSLFNCDDGPGGCMTYFESLISIVANRYNSWILVAGWPQFLVVIIISYFEAIATFR